MAKFTDYTQKTKPADADLLLIHDNAGAANKKTPFSGVWSWILDKLASAVISQLKTTNKSIIPAINELNSKIVPIYTENSTVVRYPIHNGSRFLAVFAPMGTDGYNGAPITMFVVRVNYDATNCSLTPIYKPDNVALSAKISGSEVVITQTYNSDPVNFIRAIIIPIY